MNTPSKRKDALSPESPKNSGKKSREEQGKEASEEHNHSKSEIQIPLELVVPVEHEPQHQEDLELIPEPKIYFGDDPKKLEQRVYDHVPAFTVAWLVRILAYKFRKYAYITKSNVGNCLHGNLRRKNLSVPFGIKWIWHAVWYMTRPAEDKKHFQLIEWVDENTKIALGDVHSEPLPSAIRLTQLGKDMAAKIGEGSKKHACAEPPPNQRLPEEDGTSVEHLHTDDHDSNFFAYPDLAEKYAKVMETIKECLNEVAIMRKKHTSLMQFNLMPLTASALDATVAVNLDMGSQATSQVAYAQPEHQHHHHHATQQMEKQ